MISKPIQYILDQLSSDPGAVVYGDGARDYITISVNKITTSAGVWYEKVRYFVDYKEQFAIRRSALERVMKRYIIIERKKTINGVEFLQELIRSGYIPNNTLPVEIGEVVESSIDKYLKLASFRSEIDHTNKKIIYDVVISMLATELDNILYSKFKEGVVVDAMNETIDYQTTNHSGFSQSLVSAQVYIACRRRLLKEDHATLRYVLFNRALPEWRDAKTDKQIQYVAEELYQPILNSIDKALEHPVGLRLNQQVRDYSIYYSIILEIIKKYGLSAKTIFNDANALERYIRDSLTKKYKQQSALAQQSGVRAVIYLLLTKVAFAIATEVPYELWMFGAIAYVPLSVNILFHPFVLFAMVFSVRMPDDENTDKIIDGVKKIVAGDTLLPFIVHPLTERSILTSVFRLMYAFLFILIFSFMFWVLKELEFNLVSMGVFIFFIALVSYFGIRIRNSANRWWLTSDDEKTSTFLWNFFTLPIIRTGKFLSTKFQSINVFVFLLDFIIEMPFKFILGTIDGFISFVKDKADESY